MLNCHNKYDARDLIRIKIAGKMHKYLLIIVNYLYIDNKFRNGCNYVKDDIKLIQMNWYTKEIKWWDLEIRHLKCITTLKSMNTIPAKADE